MDLIFDTHALLWLVAGDPKLSEKVLAQLADPDTRSFISAVTIWEYADLHRRDRLPGSISVADLQSEIGFELLDFPASAWTQCEQLPMIHRDPIDRMLIAHAIDGGLTLVTADRRMQRYPVPTLW